MTTTKTSKLPYTNTKVEGQFRVLALGDVHLGHRQTPTDHILRRLRAMLSDAVTQDLDLLVIEGDLFDRLLYLNMDHLGEIETWILWLLVVCKRYKVALRVLEGTPSHDMKQNTIFGRLMEHVNVELDFMYIDDLYIEHNTQWGMHILYLPDEYSTHIDKCYHDARSLMQVHGVEQVDFAVMHGAFDYQLPDIPGIETHNSQLWQALVSRYIFIGHIHQASQNGKILASGSFDRLAHNEEEPKGMTQVTLTGKGDDIRFIENTLAWLYKTIDVQALEVDEAYQVACDALEAIVSHPAGAGAKVRLKGLRNDPLDALVDRLKLDYPSVSFTPHKYIKTEDKLSSDTSSLSVKQFVPIDITKSNIVKLMKDRLGEDEVDNHALTLLKRMT